ncbi:hypothetical protein DFJ74DRAFT_34973 [Hyaloraphidium curvatum]|nr:hypothetical protein DFJ74DRAFT_34973 [Hyaloraphidium curvatum]
MAEDMPCECQYNESRPSDACGESSECINRELYIECTSCPCRHHCQNKRFQRHQYAAVEVFEAGKKGLGIRALQDLPSGTFVFEYVGEVIPTHTFLKRTQQYARDSSEHFYFMSLTSNEVIDATKKGSIARFVNHSCDPNCATQKWIVRGRFRIGIFTTKFVAKGEELSFDYQFQRYGQEAQKCYCGTAKCRGFIGGDKSSELPDFEALGIDEDSEDEDDRRPAKSKKAKEPAPMRSLETKEDVMKLIRVLTRSADARPSKVRKLLDRLEATTSIGVWREFLRFRGMTQLKAILMDSDDFQRCSQVMRIVKLVPIASRNSSSLVESQIESVVQSFVDNPDAVLRQQASDILEAWKALEVVYKIPKRIVQADSTPEDATTPKTPTDGLQKRNLDDAFGKRDEDAEAKKPRPDSADSVAAPWANVAYPEAPSRRRSLGPPPPKVDRYVPSDAPRRTDSDRRSEADRDDARRLRDAAKTPEEPQPGMEPNAGEDMPQEVYAEPVPGCPGWLRMLDPMTQIFYYLHEITGETLWDPPPGAEYNGMGGDMDGARDAGDGAVAEDGRPREREDRSRDSRASHGRENGRSHSSSHSKRPRDGSEKRKQLSAEKQKKLLVHFASTVSRLLSKWKNEMDRDQFKYLAKKITETLVEKESREADPAVKPTSETEAKIKKYITGYMERLKSDPKYPANIKKLPPKVPNGDAADGAAGNRTPQEDDAPVAADGGEGGAMEVDA